MTATLRRLGEDIFRGVVTKGVQDVALEHSVESRPRTAAFFKSTSLPLRFVSTLIVLKTVTQGKPSDCPQWSSSYIVTHFTFSEWTSVLFHAGGPTIVAEVEKVSGGLASCPPGLYWCAWILCPRQPLPLPASQNPHGTETAPLQIHWDNAWWARAWEPVRPSTYFCE